MSRVGDGLRVTARDSSVRGVTELDSERPVNAEPVSTGVVVTGRDSDCLSVTVRGSGESVALYESGVAVQNSDEAVVAARDLDGARVTA